MTEADPDEIEHHTGLPLPARYRDVLPRYPEAIIELTDENGIGPENYELYRDKQTLIDCNKGSREGHFTNGDQNSSPSAITDVERRS